MAKGEVPKFTWGAAYVNTLNVGWPLDSALAWSEPSPDSVWADIPSNGERDAWVPGTYDLLQAAFRWIPTANETVPVTITGWDGATGVREFLEWARAGNILRFYPDKDVGSYIECYLIEPLNGAPTLERDGTRQLTLKLRASTLGTNFTGY